jgi:tetratricopeptide (TPR) repeat protein
LGELSGAVEAYRKAIASRPTFYLAYYQLALVELQQERTEEAIALLQDVARLNPSHADAHYELGKAYSKLGRTSEAIAELEKATI